MKLIWFNSFRFFYLVHAWLSVCLITLLNVCYFLSDNHGELLLPAKYYVIIILLDFTIKASYIWTKKKLLLTIDFIMLYFFPSQSYLWRKLDFIGWLEYELICLKFFSTSSWTRSCGEEKHSPLIFTLNQK
jgi:hypothetical protein